MNARMTAMRRYLLRAAGGALVAIAFGAKSERNIDVRHFGAIVPSTAP